MRTVLNRVLFFVFLGIILVVGLLIAKPGAELTVQPMIEDVTLKIPSADEMMGIAPVARKSPELDFHIVKEGEWLSTICPDVWREVAELNRLENPDLIYPGQRLLLTQACVSTMAVQNEVEASTDTEMAREEPFEVPAPVNAVENANVAEALASRLEASGVAQVNPAMRFDADGVIQCDVTLQNGERAFQWRLPGRNPIGDEDPEEYLDTLARSEDLPNEAREYFLAELRKGDQGDFATERLSRCQYLGTMVGKKVNGEIRPYRHTVVNWNTELYRKKRVSWGKRKQTQEEADLNDTARRYEFVVGSDRWVLLRANICGNLILRKEPLDPPQAEESVPEPEEEPPPQRPCIYQGDCPGSRLQDCAMPGCVSRVPLPDAIPACAASCENAHNPNSDPSRERRIPQMHSGPPIVPIPVPLSHGDEPLGRSSDREFPRIIGAFVPEGTDPKTFCQDFDDLKIGTYACP